MRTLACLLAVAAVCTLTVAGMIPADPEVGTIHEDFPIFTSSGLKLHQCIVHGAAGMDTHILYIENDIYPGFSKGDTVFTRVTFPCQYC